MAGVSAETIKAYETGLRQPTRSYLVAILDALKVERHLRNDILVGAGFAPDGDSLGPAYLPHYMYSAEAAADAYRRHAVAGVRAERIRRGRGDELADRAVVGHRPRAGVP